MNYSPGIHHRRSIRLKGYNYGQAGMYFITICAWQRQRLFGSVKNGEMILTNFGEIAREEWLRTPTLRPNIALAEFVVMPNHFHGIVVVLDAGENVGEGTQQRAPTDDTNVDTDMNWDMDFDIGRGTQQRAQPSNTPSIYLPISHAQSICIPTKPARTGTLPRALPSDTPSNPSTESFGKPTVNTIPTIIRGYKSSVSNRINLLRNSPRCPVWHRNYYEHVVRNEADYLRIAAYILDNPHNWKEDSLYNNTGKDIPVWMDSPEIRDELGYR